jgi:predicted SAM-dependent methyltransferase
LSSLAPIRLHLGAGDLRFPGWVNLDLCRGQDLSEGLPGWDSGSVEAVYSCHFLEHLDYAHGEKLLAEVFRVLRPGGAARVGVPDFAVFAKAYVKGDRAFARRYLRSYVGAPASRKLRLPDPVAALLAVVYDFGHRAIYDEPVLTRALLRAGFPKRRIHRCAFGQSRYLGRWQLDARFADHTLFLEAQKP